MSAPCGFVNELTESRIDIAANRSRNKKEFRGEKISQTPRRGTRALQSFFVFVQFQSNSDFTPVPTPTHAASKHVHNFSQSRKTFSMRCERDGNSRGWENYYYRLIHTIPLMYAESTCGIIKHIEQKINFIFFDFLLGPKGFSLRSKNEKMIVQRWKCRVAEFLTQQQNRQQWELFSSNVTETLWLLTVPSFLF